MYLDSRSWKMVLSRHVSVNETFETHSRAFLVCISSYKLKVLWLLSFTSFACFMHFKILIILYLFWSFAFPLIAHFVCFMQEWRLRASHISKLQSANLILHSEIFFVNKMRYKCKECHLGWLNFTVPIIFYRVQTFFVNKLHFKGKECHLG